MGPEKREARRSEEDAGVHLSHLVQQKSQRHEVALNVNDSKTITSSITKPFRCSCSLPSRLCADLYKLYTGLNSSQAFCRSQLLSLLLHCTPSAMEKRVVGY